MAVDAVDADVELAAHEPLGIRGLPIEDLVPRFAPVELLREVGPEPLRVFVGPFVDARVVDVGVPAELLGRFKDPVLR